MNTKEALEKAIVENLVRNIRDKGIFITLEKLLIALAIFALVNVIYLKGINRKFDRLNQEVITILKHTNESYVTTETYKKEIRSLNLKVEEHDMRLKDNQIYHEDFATEVLANLSRLQEYLRLEESLSKMALEGPIIESSKDKE